jgi:RHS repeat-associated protein
MAHSDTVMGDWAFQYDSLNRLTAAAPAANVPTSLQNVMGCYGYDGFGNRTLAGITSSDCMGTNSATASYNANNQVTWTTVNAATSGFSYDQAGNVLNDGQNKYLYDGEGRLCAVDANYQVSSSYTQYVYDASGTRVAKGSLTSWPTTCGAPGSNGFSLTNQYLLDLGGDQVTELNGSGGWVHSNVWAGAHLDATYDTKGLHFHLADPLGTRRVQTSALGAIEENIQSLPFGDGLSTVIPAGAPATADDATEHHFTGKERDAESGNDYFGARYYASSMGRFMSPDWSAKVEPVPYAKLDDPQTLNLYAYLRNNPLAGVDADGHCGAGPDDSCPKLSKDDTAAVKAQVDASNKPTADDKKGGNHETAVQTGKDANGNHAIVPAQPGAVSDLNKNGAPVEVKPGLAADPSKQGTIVSVEVNAHIHPSATQDHLETDSNNQNVTKVNFWKQVPSPQDLAAAIPGANNLVVGAGTFGNASMKPTVYFYDSKGITCTESYKDFLK